MIEAIDALLPQTQCTKCGFDGCRPYARAIAEGQADINRCPPGGADGIERLARLLQRAPIALDHSRGREQAPTAALIDESRCIGCTLCIQACPVDAIVGAAKVMHTVLLDACTGCDLCLAPCPVDCIEMVSVGELRDRGFAVAQHDPAQWRRPAASARIRFEARRARLARERAVHEERLAVKAREKLASLDPAAPDGERKRAVIEAALERARARRAAAKIPIS
ncbi:MAG: electron transport complex subunit RsxB [Betaproteobacteria bacterium]